LDVIVYVFRCFDMHDGSITQSDKTYIKLFYIKI